MKREELITRMKEACAVLASEMNYNVRKDTVKKADGFWGVEFHNNLEKENGDCSNESMWIREGYEENYGDDVEFRFRFADPCICIDWRKVDGSLCEVEVGGNEENGWKIAQITMFEPDKNGMWFMQKILHAMKQIMQDWNLRVEGVGKNAAD